MTINEAMVDAIHAHIMLVGKPPHSIELGPMKWRQWREWTVEMAPCCAGDAKGSPEMMNGVYVMRGQYPGLTVSLPFVNATFDSDVIINRSHPD